MIILLISAQLALKQPTGTKLGNINIHLTQCHVVIERWLVPMHNVLYLGVMWTFEYMANLASQLDFNYYIHVSIPILLHKNRQKW